MRSHLTAADPPRSTPIDSGPTSAPRVRSLLRHPVAVHLAVLIGYIGVGIILTWPHATYLAGKLPRTRDAGSYVWGFWWMARSVLHLSDPWVTKYIAAPVGAPLGMHALMPLAGAAMTPVTLLFGPSASYNLLSILLPGLTSYAMYRVARLWLPSQVGAIAAGAFFGFSAMLSYQSWVHLNLAAGALFLPMTLEAAVRLRRRPRPVQAVILGLVVGASMLVDQESSVLALILAALALLPWLLPTWVPAGQARPSAENGTPIAATADPSRWANVQRRLLGQSRHLASRLPSLKVHWVRLLLAVLAGAVALLIAAPQLIAIAHANAAGSPPETLSVPSYLQGIRLPDMFLPAPRVASYGLPILHAGNNSTFGAVPSLLALIGFGLAWRRRNAWLLALLLLGAAALALGSALSIRGGTYTPDPQLWYGVRLSRLLPFTWFTRLPDLSGFREPSRIAVLGLISIALLAGYTVNWIWYHARPLVGAVLALGILELGLATPHGATTMPTGLPALDRPIAADHSASIVVDIPFGFRGGTGVTGLAFDPESQVLATADGHPLADALLSRVPSATAAGAENEPFYHDLISAQTGHYHFTPAELLIAAKNAAHMNVGWVLLWVHNKHLRHYLVATGFSYVYRADGASVWRPDGYANAIWTSPRR